MAASTELAEHLGSASGPTKQNERPHYHPFEEISEAAFKNSNGATLIIAETSRTIIKGCFDDEVHERIMWPDLPYVSDENGNTFK
ncbi:hypothetical protein PTKIN_Ptkin05aG0105600 [Pterospermum kingtungense]